MPPVRRRRRALLPIRIIVRRGATSTRIVISPRATLREFRRRLQRESGARIDCVLFYGGVPLGDNTTTRLCEYGLRENSTLIAPSDELNTYI